MKPFALFLSAWMVATAAVADVHEISTPNTTLLLRADVGDFPRYVYYGSHLKSSDIAALMETHPQEVAAYPTYGLDCPSEAAIAVTHADGNMTLDLKVKSVEEKSEGNAVLTVVHMEDPVFPFQLDLCYRAYDDVDVIETWTEMTHQEKKPVQLRLFASGTLPIRRGDVWLSSLYGTWADEGRVCEEPLTPGVKVIRNRDGARNSHTSHAEVMFSLDGQPQELTGRTIGAALCYSGNYRLRVQTDDSDYHKFFAGIWEENSEYKLAPREKFETPVLALAYSNEGLSGVSRIFHKWGRAYKMTHGNQERQVLLNSWEGVYFDINEEGMHQMMRDIKDMGGELFVMDDGWFGDKYPRNRDTCSLGDWVVDKRKLPNGIPGLVKAAKEIGIDFGIWYEPEMTNSTSELFESHPEWVVKADNRNLVYGRGGTQLVLDLANPKVQDFIVGLFDQLMTENPDVHYVKWDANMDIRNHGSQYLTRDLQSHLYIEYHRGFAKVCDRIRAKYPDLIIQACASGGGRANWGVMPWFDEFWVSDNTDALQRIYMQWGTSYFFPAIAMASHISAAPNHQTFRVIPLKFRIDVAMSGRLGMEIQPKNMTDEEKAQCRKAIAEYKEIRPVVQMGNIYRLLSPYKNKGLASLMYVSDAKDKAVFYWWKTETFMDQHLPRVPMAGLDPDATYKVRELNRIDNTPLPFEGKSFTGAYLMANGLEMPYTHNLDYHKLIAWASRVILLEKE